MIYRKNSSESDILVTGFRAMGGLAIRRLLPSPVQIPCFEIDDMDNDVRDFGRFLKAALEADPDAVLTLWGGPGPIKPEDLSDVHISDMEMQINENGELELKVHGRAKKVD